MNASLETVNQAREATEDALSDHNVRRCLCNWPGPRCLVEAFPLEPLDSELSPHKGCLRMRGEMHKKNRHELIESLISAGATHVQVVNLLTHVADPFQLTLDQVREGARLLSGKTAKGDCDSLTAETTMTMGHFRAALGWAYAQVQTGASEQQPSPKVGEAEICYQEAVAATAFMSAA